MKTIVVIVGLLVLALFLVASCGKQGGEAVRVVSEGEGGGGSPPSGIRATSCDADQICEANVIHAPVGAKLGGIVYYGTGDHPAFSTSLNQQNGMWYIDHYGKSQFFATAAFEGETVVDGNFTARNARIGPVLGGSGEPGSEDPRAAFEVTNEGGVYAYSLVTEYAAVNSASANGTGDNAYACFDHNGKLYRSEEPCN